MILLSRILAAQPVELFCLAFLISAGIVLLSSSVLARAQNVKSDTSPLPSDEDMTGDVQAPLDRSIETDLARAIGLNQFRLHYQVQTRIQNARICGYEALLRWEHPVHGNVSPGIFIPIAERSGAIVEIGEWVLKTACREAAAWKAPHKVAVNVSAIQITDPNLPRLVHQTLLETGLPASRLELELTESALVVDKIRALHVLRQIKALGVTVALDDFGTGYASLETLRSFPFDRIKIDRTFIEEIESSARQRTILRTIIALGRALDITVLAEGIENQLQLTVLAEEGCNEAQGFYLGRPNRIPQTAIDPAKVPLLPPAREFKSTDILRAKNPILAAVATAGSLTSLHRAPKATSHQWHVMRKAS